MRIALLVVLSVVLLPGNAAGARGPRVFTIAGGSSARDRGRLGMPATDVLIDPRSVLGLPDGSVAFFDPSLNRVLRLDRAGRIGVLAGDGRNGEGGDGGPALRARLWWADDLALDPRGILIADGIGGNVRLVRPDGVIVRIAGGGRRDGVGIPATQADFEGVSGLAVTPEGSILAANVQQDWVRQISQDGTLLPFAGSGRASGQRGDGGQATRAEVFGPESVAVADDRSVYIAAYKALRRVAPDGTISTLRTPFEVERLVTSPLGVLAGAAGTTGEGRYVSVAVVLLHGNGTSTLLAGGGRPSSFDGDGEIPQHVFIDATDVSPSSDGGVLISSFDRIRYIPPERPSRLAVAITRPTLTSPRQLRVSLATTMPAVVSAWISGGPSAAPPRTVGVAAGDSTLSFGRRLRAGAYILHVEARGADGQVARDTQDLFFGKRLTMRGARRVARRQVMREAHFLYGGGRIGPCRRYGPRRVDCLSYMHDLGCEGVTSVRLHRDGLVWLRRNHRCRLRRRAGGRDRPMGFIPLR